VYIKIVEELNVVYINLVYCTLMQKVIPVQEDSWSFSIGENKGCVGSILVVKPCPEGHMSRVAYPPALNPLPQHIYIYENLTSSLDPTPQITINTALNCYSQWNRSQQQQPI
jgi:hypothetical protein